MSHKRRKSNVPCILEEWFNCPKEYQGGGVQGISSFLSWWCFPYVLRVILWPEGIDLPNAWCLCQLMAWELPSKLMYKNKISRWASTTQGPVSTFHFALIQATGLFLLQYFVLVQSRLCLWSSYFGYEMFSKLTTLTVGVFNFILRWNLHNIQLTILKRSTVQWYLVIHDIVQPPSHLSELITSDHPISFNSRFFPPASP